MEELPAVSWPLSQDYNEAVQNPRTSFADEELRQAEAVANALGLPLPRAGNFADVYELRHPAGGRWAVKCFTRPVSNLRERYAEISRHLRAARLSFTVAFTYLDEGVRIRGAWYPVLKMQWVEGFHLNQFVRDHLGKPNMLDKLSGLWLRMARRLREAEVAHGDLQHGNVLLVPGSRTTSLVLKLIDYDGMFVPALAGTASGEVGHPAYQHPQRLREATYGPEVDRFPLLVIATALRCLAVGGQDLWDRYDTGDNLLFRESDLRQPGESALFRELWRLPDPSARALVARLALAAQGPIGNVPFLDDVVAEDAVLLLSAEQRREAAAVLGSNGVAVAMSAAPPQPTLEDEPEPDLVFPRGEPFIPPPSWPEDEPMVRRRRRSGNDWLLWAVLAGVVAFIVLAAVVFTVWVALSEAGLPQPRDSSRPTSARSAVP